MEEVDFRKLLQEQSDAIVAQVDKKIEIAVEGIDSKIANAVEEIDKRAKERTEQHVGAISEDFRSRLDAVIESVQPIAQTQEDIKGIKETTARTQEILDVTFQRAGELTEDVEMLKSRQAL